MSTVRQAEQLSQKNKPSQRLPYQVPVVIYQGTITTRAGSPVGITSDPDKSGVDPADLFGNGD